MRHLLYFIAGVTKIEEDEIRAAGLGSSCGGMYFARREHGSGPGGKPGQLFAAYPGAMPSGLRIDYRPDEQVWRECNGGKFWVGCWKDAKPGPADLEREEMIEGHWVRLDGEHDWLVPVARTAGGGTRFPQVIRFDRDGGLEYEVRADLAGMYHRAEVMFQRIAAQESRFPYRDLCDFLADAIAVNYRVSKWEIGLLGVFQTETIMRGVEAVIDVPTILEFMESQKKTNGTDGSNDCGVTGVESVTVAG